MHYQASICSIVECPAPAAVYLYLGLVPPKANVLVPSVVIPHPPVFGDIRINWINKDTARIIQIDEDVFDQELVRDEFWTFRPKDRPTSFPCYVAQIPGTGIFAIGKTRWGSLLNLSKLLRDIMFVCCNQDNRLKPVAKLYGCQFGLIGIEDFVFTLMCGPRQSKLALREWLQGHEDRQNTFVESRNEMISWLKYQMCAAADFDLIDHIKSIRSF